MVDTRKNKKKHSKLFVEGSKSTRTKPIRASKLRNSSHVFTHSSGKGSVNRKTGRK